MLMITYSKVTLTAFQKTESFSMRL